MSAEDRVYKLVDVDSFTPVASGVESRSAERWPGDGVVAGTGLVDGRPVAVCATEPSFLKGSVGVEGSRKLTNLFSHAQRLGMPVVCLSDSSGARVHEGQPVLQALAELLLRVVEARRYIPVVTAVLGGCAGAMSVLAGLSHLVVGCKKKGYMFLYGPRAVKHLVGEEVELTRLGDLENLSAKAGTVHIVAEDEDSAMKTVKQLLQLLPQNSSQTPEQKPFTDPVDRPIPEKFFEEGSSKLVSDVCDRGSCIELRPKYGGAVSTVLGRLSGFPAGFVASNPFYNKGLIDGEAAVKTSEFVELCSLFNIPVITLVNTPGFSVGLSQEEAGILRHVAQVVRAYADCRAPKIAVILGQAYGAAYIAMGTRFLGADYVYAIPQAEVASMPPEAVVETIHSKKLTTMTEEEKQALAAQEKINSSSQTLLSNGLVDEIIDKQHLRSKLARTLLNIYKQNAT
ncbi:MAG: carboxyl transferase domain-containing protein [Candidatus Caldarchaeum sp.]